MTNVEKFVKLHNAQPNTDLGDISVSNIFDNPKVKAMKAGEVVSSTNWSHDPFVVIKDNVGVIVLVNDFDNGVTCVTDDVSAQCASWKRAGLEKNSVIDTEAKMEHILAIVNSYK